MRIRGGIPQLLQFEKEKPSLAEALDTFRPMDMRL